MCNFLQKSVLMFIDGVYKRAGSQCHDMQYMSMQHNAYKKHGHVAPPRPSGGGHPTKAAYHLAHAQIESARHNSLTMRPCNASDPAPLSFLSSRNSDVRFPDSMKNISSDIHEVVSQAVESSMVTPMTRDAATRALSWSTSTCKHDSI